MPPVKEIEKMLIAIYEYEKKKITFVLHDNIDINYTIVSFYYHDICVAM